MNTFGFKSFGSHLDVAFKVRVWIDHGKYCGTIEVGDYPPRSLKGSSTINSLTDALKEGAVQARTFIESL